MSDKCRYCNKKLIKNDDVILEAPYPGTGQKLFNYIFRSSLREYGDISHRDCFLKQTKDDLLLLKLVSRIESKQEKKAK